MEKESPMYLIQVQKQTAMTGEVVTISANLPKDGDVKGELSKLTSAIDARMEEVNSQILKATKGRYSATDADIAAQLGIPASELNGKSH